MAPARTRRKVSPVFQLHAVFAATGVAQACCWARDNEFSEAYARLGHAGIEIARQKRTAPGDILVLADEDANPRAAQFEAKRHRRRWRCLNLKLL